MTTNKEFDYMKAYLLHNGHTQDELNEMPIESIIGLYLRVLAINKHMGVNNESDNN